MVFLLEIKSDGIARSRNLSKKNYVYQLIDLEAGESHTTWFGLYWIIPTPPTVTW